MSPPATVAVQTIPVPYERELDRYAQILASSPLPTYAAASHSDLDGAGSEATFAQAFAGLPPPFGLDDRLREPCPAARLPTTPCPPAGPCA